MARTRSRSRAPRRFHSLVLSLSRRTALAICTLSLILGCGSGEDQQLEEDRQTLDVSKFPRIGSALPADPALEERIDEILGAMSLEEKVGQVIQAELQYVTPEDIRDFHLGSVLNGGGSFPSANKRSTLADWVATADAFWEASMDTSDGGQAIPVLWGVDAVHGHNNVFGATLFPHNIGLGAMNDPELVERIGEATARQIRLTGQDWNFSPTVAVPRDDRWGRTYEGYSEDPEIVAAYAAAMVRGIQGTPGGDGFLGQDRVLATAKHFIGDGGTDGGKDRGDNLASPDELLDVHFAGYDTALRAGVQTVMASFSSWRGKKLHEHRTLLTEVLKDQVGFDGFVVGDWNGHGEVPGCTNDNCPQSLIAGVDMYMVPEDWRALYGNLLDQVRGEEVPLQRLEDAVRRILRVKLRAGLFERPRPSERPLSGREDLLGSEEHRSLAREAVRKSLVLLKNNDAVLPLDPSSRVLVFGSAADSFAEQSGGWTLTWQGTDNTKEDFPNGTTIWEGIRDAVEAAGGTALRADAYSEDPKDSESMRGDVAIVVYGEGPYAEFFGDLESLVFGSGATRNQELATLQALAEQDIPVVSVFLSGRPLVVNAELNASDAFVAAWLPGTEGAGVADVLFRTADGEIAHDFFGRLSFSWPRRPEQAVLNRHDTDAEPLFPYGYGLDYGAASREVTVDPIAEEYLEEKTSPALITEYFGRDADSAAEFRFYVASAGGEPVAEVGGNAVSGDGIVSMAITDREAQGDSRRLTWRGGAEARVELRAEDPLDMSRLDPATHHLLVEASIEQAPSSTVRLAIGCGADCRGAVDVTSQLNAQESGNWFALRVPLHCLANAGVDLSGVETPVELVTDGRLSLVVSRVAVRESETGETAGNCPPTVP